MRIREQELEMRGKELGELEHNSGSFLPVSPSKLCLLTVILLISFHLSAWLQIVLIP